ncbi:unnamed protein product [Polarella glacialis]|uniref:Methyltransferase type 11 domain-containing protein n=1 Tax=Polarella glacialis TaxID=89957 RepID=A0A813LG24_POLGL|nr:unnamed protein product [Polarella glacialis]
MLLLWRSLFDVCAHPVQVDDEDSCYQLAAATCDPCDVFDANEVISSALKHTAQIKSSYAGLSKCQPLGMKKVRSEGLLNRLGFPAMRKCWSLSEKVGEPQSIKEPSADTIGEVSAALRAGRVLEARRKMLRMEDVQRDCVARSLPCREQVKRIGSRFEDSLPELVVDGGNDWVTSRDSEAAFRLRDGEVKLVFTIDIEDCSPVLLLAALCEYDLSKSYNPDILEAEAVQHDGADSIWRVVKKSKWSGMLEDNIRYLSAIDALDESEPSLWVSLYAHCGMSDLDAADQETHGFRLPPPKPDCSRSWSSRSTFSIRPMPSKGCDCRWPSTGCRLTTSVITRPSKSSCSTIQLSPTWAIRRLLCGEVDGFSTLLRKHIAECPGLSWRHCRVFDAAVAFVILPCDPGTSVSQQKDSAGVRVVSRRWRNAELLHREIVGLALFTTEIGFQSSTDSGIVCKAARTSPQAEEVQPEESFRMVLHCPPIEHGINWEAFLRSVCEKCPVGKPCNFSPEDEGLQIAAKAVAGEDQPAFVCISGLLSAMIVVAQYYLVKSPPEDLKGFLSQATSLSPFPFSTKQYTLYANMVPVRLMTCDVDAANRGDLQNVFVPRVHIEDSGLCGMSFSDDLLVRRCRSQRNNAGHVQRDDVTDFLSDITCPDFSGLSIDQALSAKIQKYNQRAEGMQCQDSRGMWNDEMSDLHKCILVTVGHLMNFRPGQLVLDWGSGCGHKLSWAKMLFDVNGLGLDIMGPAVAWAKDHSAGKFCHADGRDLSWVPDNMFDHVISYAAIYHLAKEDQCHAGIQLVKKLKIGGRAFLGWNHGPVMNNWEWLGCFKHSRAYMEELHGPGTTGVEVDFQALEDAYLFPPNAHVMEHKRSFLFQYPAYSIFLTRLA